MMLNITDEEREYLVELLDEKYKRSLHELNHTDTLEFKKMLRHQVDLLEGIMAKFQADAKPSEK